MIIYKISQVIGSCGFRGKGLNSIIKKWNELEDLTAKIIILDGQTERIGPGKVSYRDCVLNIFIMGNSLPHYYWAPIVYERSLEIRNSWHNCKLKACI